MNPRAWLRRRLHRWLGPDQRTQKRLEVLTGRVVALNLRNEQLTRQVDKQAAEHQQALYDADDLWRSELDTMVDQLAAARALAEHREPDTGACRKVRLRDQAEAEAFARAVEHSVSAQPGSLAGYECRACPRQPVDARLRFWHVYNADPRFRTQRHREGNHRLEERRQRGRQLAEAGAETVATRIGDLKAQELRARVADRTVPAPAEAVVAS